METIKPPRLRKGDLIALVSPASTPSTDEKIQESVRYLEGCGYRVRVGEHAAREWGYLAGTDAQRVEDLNMFVQDTDVRAIFALRGGYGCGRILERVNYAALRRDPKIISGFSDITALQLAIYRHCRLVTFSGPMPAVEFWKDPDPYTEENFWRLITSSRKPGRLENPKDDPAKVEKGGAAQGILLGGNLSLVAATIGTRYMPSLRGAICVLEEVDEAPYRVDRMFTQLRNAGVQGGLAGLVLGKFTNCEPKDASKPHRTVEDVIREACEWSGRPSLTNFCYGHVPRKLTVPFGARAKLDSRRAAIELLEAAVR